MLTSDELQKLAKEAEERAKETRRSSYINEHVYKPAIVSNRYILGWSFYVILGCGCLYSLVIRHDSFDQLVLMGITMVNVWVVLWLVISWQGDRYQKKVRKAEAKFDELVRKENLEFHVTDWEYYKNS